MKILQCWDDGIVSDIRLCDILRKYDARASFNLNADLHEAHRSHGWQYQDTWVERLGRDELSSVYEGFTIANHSLSHPDLTHLPWPEVDRQIWDNRYRLQDWFDQPIVGFAYPFGSWDDHIIDVLKASGHLYARTTLNEPWRFPPGNWFTFNPTCHFLDEHFRALYEQAKTIGVFYFWGHSYEMTHETMWLEFEDKIREIAHDQDSQWADMPDLIRA